LGFLDRTKQLFDLLDFDEARIVRLGSMVFLCGGENSEVGEVPTSVREALLRHIPNRNAIGQARVILAEKAVEALPETSFDNLLDFEECIAAAVDCVVLVAESAGSICELGAFAKTEEICQKLAVIILNKYNNKKSSITLGALKYIRDNSDFAEIHPFDWKEVDGGVDVPEYTLKGIVSEVDGIIDKVPRKEKFDSSRRGHLIFLILTICHILRSAKIGEIKEFLKIALKGNSIAEKDIRKYLDTLQTLGMLEKVSHGAKLVFYVSLMERVPFEFAFAEHAEDADRNIMRWLNSIAADVGAEDPLRMNLFQEHNDAA
jgi:hypothetical protein